LKKYHYLLIIFLALGFTGLTVWREFVCPECFASEPKQETFSKPSEIPFQVLDKEQALEQESGAAPQVGSPAPDFVLENLAGDEVSLADFSNRNVLLVFWAISCGWCEKERPDLIRIAEEQKDKIEVIALSPESKELLTQYAEEKEVNFVLLVDQARKTAIKYLALGTPSHFLIDKRGKIAAVKPGYADYDDLLMLVQSLEEK